MRRMKYRLTEIDLKTIVKDSVKRILKELKAEQPTDGIRCDTIQGLKIYYGHDYIPKGNKCDKNAENVRNCVWCFKNNPDEEYSNKEYKRAYDEFFEFLYGTLVETLGDNAEEHVLLCVPASTAESNLNRWKRFSNEVTDELGMMNGYSQVKFKRDGKPSHVIGRSKSNLPMLSFGCKWWKGKKVVLFDDMITSGYTMKRIKDQLEMVGAKVVFGITYAKSIGKE